MKTMKKEVLAIVPARGGSKSIPKKNIYPILGKPLIAYSIEDALKSQLINRVFLSTDSQEIADVGKQYGAEVPILRPAELAEDLTPDLPVFQHVLKYLKETEGYQPDLVVHVWPTSPLRIPKHFDEAIELMINNPEADSVRSVTTPPSQTPFKMWRCDEGSYMTPIMNKEYPSLYEKMRPHEMPRQALPIIHVQTGYLSVIKRETITDKNSMMGDKIVPFFHDPDIYTELDSFKDLYYTEMTIKKFYEKK